MHGLHLTADLQNCAAPTALMTDPHTLRRACLQAVAQAGLQAVGELFHRFAPASGQAADSTGVTGIVLLAESHLAVHTWPEMAAVTLDVYVCNLGQDNSSKAEALMAALLPGFAPQHTETHRLQRGSRLLQRS